jgi:mono/diheme cytochrome c family protein
LDGISVSSGNIAALRRQNADLHFDQFNSRPYSGSGASQITQPDKEEAGMFRKIWFATAIALVLLGLLSGAVFAQSTGDATRGEQLWQQTGCKSCHGANGEGSYAAPRAADGKTAEEWIMQVRSPRANMPAFSETQISDQAITDMHAYMQTLSAPASFAPKQFPLPAAAHPGLTLMAQERCVACHGDGVQFVQMRFVSQGREVTTDAVIKQLRTPNQFMPTFSATQVTDEQAAQIADYLKSLTTAPTTLPKSGEGAVVSGWSIGLLLTGLAMLLGGAFTLARRKV